MRPSMFILAVVGCRLVAIAHARIGLLARGLWRRRMKYRSPFGQPVQMGVDLGPEFRGFQSRAKAREKSAARAQIAREPVRDVGVVDGSRWRRQLARPAQAPRHCDE